MENRAERRVCTRTEFHTSVLIEDDFEQKEYEADLCDISILGMYVRADKPMAEETSCVLKIIITGQNSRLVIDSINAIVVRNDSDGIGFRFISNMEWFVLFKVYMNCGREEQSLQEKNTTN